MLYVYSAMRRRRSNTNGGEDFFTPIEHELDADTSTILELMHGNLTTVRSPRDTILVLDMEFTHAHNRHQHSAATAGKRDDVALLPREVGYLVLERVGTGCKWRIAGYEQFCCPLPRYDQCAMVRSRVANVTAGTRQGMRFFEDTYFDILQRSLPDGTSVEALLRDAPRLMAACGNARKQLLQQLERVVLGCTLALHASRNDAVSIRAAMARLRTRVLSEQASVHDVQSECAHLCAVIDDASYNIMERGCVGEHERAMRRRCMEMYEEDELVGRRVDSSGRAMRRLISRMGHSLVVCKHTHCLDAVRNHVARYGAQLRLAQPRGGLSVIDVAIFNQVSRVRFGDAKLSTTAAGLAFSVPDGLQVALSRVLNELQHEHDERPTPTSLEKCTMILTVATHIFGWFSAGIQMADLADLADLPAGCSAHTRQTDKHMKDPQPLVPATSDHDRGDSRVPQCTGIAQGQR